MAAGDPTSGSSKFPVPVSFDDDTPSPDFCRIVLTIEEMRIRKPLIGKARATNATITPSFSESVVMVTVVVNDDKQVRLEMGGGAEAG